jgi:carbonic anhydrase
MIKTAAAACLLALAAAPALASDLTADQALAKLKEGNERFVSGKSMHPHTDAARLIQAGAEDQGKHAFATVISCSDSRVPVERLFDAGIMDTFIIRVAGNVIDTDEAGSIEYGLAHVNTPLFVVLGHTQCGAVKAVTAAVKGHGHALEVNIPPLVDNIGPAVKRAIEQNPKAEDKEVVPAAIVENVWQSVHDLFMKSPAAREMVKAGKVKVVGALYDVGTGKVEWLAEDKVGTILAEVEKNPERQMQKMAAEEGGGEGHGGKEEEGKH